MLVVVVLRTSVRGRVMLAWAEFRSPGAWAGLHNLAALVQAGRVDTVPPGRTEAVQVLKLAAGGTAEGQW